MVFDDRERKEIGRTGEDIAAAFLKRKGFTIIERNFRRPWGEIDIIAKKDQVFRFVEVKAVSREILPDVSREMSEYRPEEQVHASKLKKIARTAELYMNQHKNNLDFQIDVVGVFIDSHKRIARCRLFEQVL